MNLARLTFLLYTAVSQPFLEWWRANRLSDWFTAENVIQRTYGGLTTLSPFYPYGKVILPLSIFPDEDCWINIALDSPSSFCLEDILAPIGLASSPRTAADASKVLIVNAGGVQKTRGEAFRFVYHWGPDGHFVWTVET